MPMHYPNLNNHNIGPKKVELTPEMVFQPPPRYDAAAFVTKEKVKSDSAKNAKGKPSVENWIPELTRMRSVHRHIAVAKETIQDMIMREENTAREMKQFKRSDFEKAKEMENLKVSYCRSPSNL